MLHTLEISFGTHVILAISFGTHVTILSGCGLDIRLRTGASVRAKEKQEEAGDGKSWEK
jgi:hypothetical protein